MTKRMIVMVVALVIVFGGLFGFNLFRTYKIKEFFNNYTPPAVTVSTIVAKEKTWHPMLAGVGSFLAINGVDVNSQASGNVTRIFFKSGQYVKKSTPLIQIDDRIEQASLKNAQATLFLHTNNFKRQADLIKTQSTSSSNVDTAKANLAQASAMVEKIQAEINQKNIKAPFSGRLGVRMINLGQYISPGSTKIVTLQSMDPLFLTFYLPEQNHDKLYVGQPIRFKVEAYPNHFFAGKINAINSKIDTETHNLLIQARLPNCATNTLSNTNAASLMTKYDPLSNQRVTFCDTTKNEEKDVKEFAFVPGMFADINVLLPSKEHVIVLPRTAVSYSLYGNAVFIVKDEKIKETKKVIKRVYKHFISTGQERGNEVVVLSGVKKGDVVVNSGQLKLSNGTPVTINNSIKLNETPDPDSLGQ
jgi:membrane fusion protein (multidrug efflux system)